MMIDPKEERKFRTLMRHIALDYDGYFDAPYDMFVWSAWLEGNRAGITFAEHSESLDRVSTNVLPEEYYATLIRHPAALGRSEAAQVEHERKRAAREREFMDRWPDLCEYCRDYSSMSSTELETLVSKAAERFSTALLSRETLTGEECDLLAWHLCGWAYVIGVYDKVAAMHKKGRIFSDKFPRFVTMADRPDYETREEWTEKALDVMNGEIVCDSAQRAAEKALEEVLGNDREPGRGVPDLDDYLDKQGLTINYSEARVVKVIAAVRAMQQEGMKNGLNLFHEYWEEDPNRRLHALDYLDSGDSIYSWKYFDPVKTTYGRNSRT